MKVRQIWLLSLKSGHFLIKKLPTVCQGGEKKGVKIWLWKSFKNLIRHAWPLKLLESPLTPPSFIIVPIHPKHSQQADALLTSVLEMLPPLLLLSCNIPTNVKLVPSKCIFSTCCVSVSNLFLQWGVGGWHGLMAMGKQQQLQLCCWTLILAWVGYSRTVIRTEMLIVKTEEVEGENYTAIPKNTPPPPPPPSRRGVLLAGDLFAANQMWQSEEVNESEHKHCFIHTCPVPHFPASALLFHSFFFFFLPLVLEVLHIVERCSLFCRLEPHE